MSSFLLQACAGTGISHTPVPLSRPTPSKSSVAAVIALRPQPDEWRQLIQLYTVAPAHRSSVSHSRRPDHVAPTSVGTRTPLTSNSALSSALCRTANALRFQGGAYQNANDLNQGVKRLGAPQFVQLDQSKAAANAPTQ
ncbi:hypothetical protein BKA56DRAFT_718938 [Ilyonectria sp. MPI-CAGE-AT-0026]|nr:hypothetical protein BKA56DRAFT_718938 [Ilyonectria sp. MPI-CAGE-AT-0026]